MSQTTLIKTTTDVDTDEAMKFCFTAVEEPEINRCALTERKNLEVTVADGYTEIEAREKIHTLVKRYRSIETEVF